MAQRLAYVTGGMGGIGTAICQRLHRDGFKVIAMFTTEPGYIQSRNPVRNLADLSGMKLRAAGTGVPVLKALGAAPVGMAMPEVPQAVQTAFEGAAGSRAPHCQQNTSPRR